MQFLSFSHGPSLVSHLFLSVLHFNAFSFTLRWPQFSLLPPFRKINCFHKLASIWRIEEENKCKRRPPDFCVDSPVYYREKKEGAKNTHTSTRMRPELGRGGESEWLNGSGGYQQQRKLKGFKKASSIFCHLGKRERIVEGKKWRN